MPKQLNNWVLFSVPPSALPKHSNPKVSIGHFSFQLQPALDARASRIDTLHTAMGQCPVMRCGVHTTLRSANGRGREWGL